MSQSSLPVALITGAAKRVGRAIALHLAGAGYDIAFTYLSSAAPAEELSAEIRNLGRQPLAIRADLTDSHSAPNAVAAQFRSKFSQLDILVNNASLFQPDNPNDPSLSAKLYALHAVSPVELSRALAPLLDNQQGCIVNMVDLQAERPIPGYLTYCASKAALWCLTLGLARELAPRVRVNGIAPGVVDWAPDMTPEFRNRYLARVPLARPGTPDDVAQTVLYLANAKYVTGQILRLDGGRSIT
jgi:pteridine reductase